MKYLFIGLSFFLLSCSNKNNCNDIYQEYISFSMEAKDSLAFKRLDEAIKCDEKNENYRFEKVNYLLSIQNYKNAKKALKDLENINDIYLNDFPLLGILEIRLGNIDIGNLELKKVKNNLSKVKDKKFNFFYYETLIDLYFNGKQSVIPRLENYKEENDLNEKAVLDHLKKLVNSNMTPLNILYKSFKIEN